MGKEKEKEKIKHLDNIDALRYALNNQISWQKFAEAKLLLLLTVSGSAVASLNIIINEFDEVRDTITFKIVIGVFAVCSFISFFIVLISFYVSFDRIRKAAKFETEQIINWKYTLDKSVPELVKASKKYDLEKQRIDILIQHHLGSEITNLKYRFFNFGIVIFTIGIISLFIFLLFVKVF